MKAIRRLCIANVVCGSALLLAAMYITLDAPVRAQTEDLCGGVPRPSGSGGQNWVCCDNTTWYNANTQGCCNHSLFSLATQACCYTAGTYYNLSTEGCCLQASEVYDLQSECCCVDSVEVL